MRKIRFLSFWLMTLMVVAACNNEDCLMTEAGYPVAISLTESIDVRSVLPDGLFDQIRSLGIYAYNSNGHLEDFVSSDGSKLTVDLNRGMSYTIYALANMPVLPDAPSDEKDFIETVHSVTYDNISETGVPMCGKVSLDASEILTGSAEIEMTRLITRVAFSCDKSELTSSELVVTSVKLCQTASAVAPFSETFVPVDEMIEKEGDSVSEEDLKYLNTGGAVWLYCLENCQGILLPENDDPWLKVPSELQDASARCTYLEVQASYRGDYEGVEVSSDNVVYRFYLGKDNITDFTLERNKGVVVSLAVSDSGVFEREWKVDYGQSLPVVTASLEVIPSETVVYLSESARLKATYSKYVDGILSSSSDVSSDVIWTVDDTGIVEIEDAVMTGTGEGTTRVIASYEGILTVCDVTVLSRPGKLIFNDEPVWLYPNKEQDVFFRYVNLTSEDLSKNYFSSDACEILSVTIIDDEHGYVTVRRGAEPAALLKYHHPGRNAESELVVISKDPVLTMEGPERVMQGSDALYRMMATYEWPGGYMESEDVSGQCVWETGRDNVLNGPDGKGYFNIAAIDPDDGDGNKYSTRTDVRCTYFGLQIVKEVLVYAYSDYKFYFAMIDSTRDFEYYEVTLECHIYDHNGRIDEWSCQLPYEWKLDMAQGYYLGNGDFRFKLEINDKMEYINVKQAHLIATFRTAGEYNSEGIPWGSEVTLMRDFELSGLY